MLYWKTVAVASSTCFWLGDIDPLDGQNCIIRNSNSLQVLLCRMKDPRQWGRFWFWTWMLWIRNGSANRLKPTERNSQPIPHNWVFWWWWYSSLDCMPKKRNIQAGHLKNQICAISHDIYLLELNPIPTL